MVRGAWSRESREVGFDNLKNLPSESEWFYDEDIFRLIVGNDLGCIGLRRGHQKVRHDLAFSILSRECRVMEKSIPKNVP